MDNFHPNELKILKILEGRQNIKKISERANLSTDAVARTIDWLKTKNLVNVSEKIQKFVFLNDEGKEYLSRGLPERQLLNLIKAKNISEITIDDLIKIIDENNLKVNVHLTIGWLRRKKHIVFKDRVIVFSDFAVRDDEILLKNTDKRDLNTLSDAEKKSYEILNSRKIINLKETREIFASLTDEGIKIKENIAGLKEQISQLTPEMLTKKSWKGAEFRKYDVSVFVEPQYLAKFHPLTNLINDIREIFVGMGFKEMRGNLIEPTFWDFDALFQPQDHPARDMQDTFYLKNFVHEVDGFEKFKNPIRDAHEKGWKYQWNEEEAKKFILRTHTTAVSAHFITTLKKHDLPAKIFTIGKVFRNETIDFKHLPEFYQVEGIVVSEDVNFRNLLGILKNFYNSLGFEKIRFRPGYFPYTEMSIEPEIYLESKEQWIELGGAGIFRQEVVKPLLGFECPVLAWGLGLDRIAALRLNLSDIRDLYISDIDWLRKVKVI
ncbi:MAG: phenylalanine--tRNA ligase subunit alpha [Candidatus Altiarchaeum hamiconexum]|uniref:Phenylalanine--tRNA ligase alpha subunit n=1 Tax=Candidatus Altarchaeum hamiconexum TaxID=1803513 RepID=A0A8J7YTE2_9ARCH|nr:phenylalanine--tRNA ligase subunit alpha [Candidatus Altarchaeum hamiconexum]NCN68795.1 phenylalanine--tRNA ligase subunit alpha [Candidatus Altarchaeum hamiconexum]NCS91008.1 phenylalanine--tRNA ligase subunit alpha [Candidatus Altarchaeum hamiconexum]NCT00315.1 phenylalanine--tRNA ligase subunit alpha [Candidatus Altarchaeum hamiconexum]OIQ05900.1 MAG: hypothetical protein AUK59_02080 [Candidatus Altarchaeum sp. CG2_30_32_3053]